MPYYKKKQNMIFESRFRFVLNATDIKFLQETSIEIITRAKISLWLLYLIFVPNISLHLMLDEFSSSMFFQQVSGQKKTKTRN